MFRLGDCKYYIHKIVDLQIYILRVHTLTDTQNSNAYLFVPYEAMSSLLYQLDELIKGDTDIVSVYFGDGSSFIMSESLMHKGKYLRQITLTNGTTVPSIIPKEELDLMYHNINAVVN